MDEFLSPNTTETTVALKKGIFHVGEKRYKQMKVILVNGSSHEDGCTHTALCEVASAIQAEGIETEIFWVGSKELSGCLDCGNCNDLHGNCIFAKRAEEFIEAAKTADGFVFGSPVHYDAAAKNMVSFMNRVFYSSARDTFYLKPAAAIITARSGGTTATLKQLHEYCFTAQMPIIPSKYWNMIHGMSSEQIKQNVEAMKNMRNLGKNIAWFLKCKEAGEKADILTPREAKKAALNK